MKLYKWYPDGGGDDTVIVMAKNKTDALRIAKIEVEERMESPDLYKLDNFGKYKGKNQIYRLSVVEYGNAIICPSYG